MEQLLFHDNLTMVVAMYTKVVVMYTSKSRGNENFQKVTVMECIHHHHRLFHISVPLHTIENCLFCNTNRAIKQYIQTWSIILKRVFTHILIKLEELSF